MWKLAPLFASSYLLLIAATTTSAKDCEASTGKLESYAESSDEFGLLQVQSNTALLPGKEASALMTTASHSTPHRSSTGLLTKQQHEQPAPWDTINLMKQKFRENIFRPTTGRTVLWHKVKESMALGSIGMVLVIMAGAGVLLMIVYMFFRGQQMAKEQQMDGRDSAAYAQEHKWFIFRLCYMFSVWELICTDQYLANIPEMAVDLGASDEVMSLSVMELMALKGCTALIIGSASDKVGRRKLILWFFALLMVSVAACGLAPNVTWFQAARAAQGIAEGAVVVVGGVTRDLFDDPQERAQAVGQMIAIVMFAPMLAPSIGGALGSLVGWRVVFVILAAGMMACWPMIYLYLPETLVIQSNPQTSYWQEIGNLIRDFKLMGLLVTQTIVVCSIYFFLSNMSIILENGFGVTVMQTALFFGVCAAAVMPSAIVFDESVTSKGLLKVARASAMVLLVPIVLFGVVAGYFSNSVWAIMMCQLVYGLTFLPYAASADTLFMQPLTNSFGAAAAISAFMQQSGGAGVIAVGTALLSHSTNHARVYCWFFVGILSITFILFWLCFGINPPDWAVDGQREFEEAAAIEALKAENDALVLKASTDTGPGAPKHGIPRAKS